jgi:RNA polymerase sigma-70 factor (ECF subfamily)
MTNSRGTVGRGQVRSPANAEGDEAPEDFLEAAASGDTHAFGELYRRFSPRIFALCLRMTGQRESAEDCTQDCFVSAWKALPGFERRSSFTTWLHSIAVRAVLSKRRGLRLLPEVAVPASGVPDVTQIGAHEPPLDMERAIAALPQGARHVLVLVGIYGYTHAEAAQTLGVAEGTCKAQLHRARALLVSALGLED